MVVSHMGDVKSLVVRSIVIQGRVILVHHNCEQLIGMGQDQYLYISCKMNVEENNRQRCSSGMPLFAQDSSS